MPTTSRSAAQGDADRLDPRLPRPGGELGGARRRRRSGRRATGERIGACRGCGRIGCSGVHEFRDGFLPYVGSELKDAFEELKEVRPDLVFTHPRPPPGSSPADRSGLAFADLRRAADDGPGQYDRMKLVPYAITSLLHAARPKLRAVPARSTGSMSTRGRRVRRHILPDDLAARAWTSARESSSRSGYRRPDRRDSRHRSRARVLGAPRARLEIVRAADGERTKHLFGRQARTTLADGLRSTVD
jgi:hypothetical protein